MEKLQNLLKSIGPGILFAGAAIGGSHLVQSTRAGADFGFYLLWLIILTNFLKYPFFQYGHRYTAATGENIIEGYKKLGTWSVYTFLLLNIVTAVVNAAGVTLVTSALFQYFLKVIFGLDTELLTMTAIVLGVTIAILFLGKYPLLDKIVKVLIVVLSIFTVFAFFAALTKPSLLPADYIQPEIWTTAGIGFLISLMGWMPAPIESSAWTSLWVSEREKQTKHKVNMKEALFDFNLGYIGTAVLACFFLGLGALIMHGSGESFSDSGVVFSQQLVALYTQSLGKWSLPIISTIALITMISTTLTVIDAYPRAIEVSLKLTIMPKITGHKLYWIWVILLGFTTLGIILWFIQGLTTMIDFATIVSFLAAPVFAAINYKLVRSKFMPDIYKPGKFLVTLSWLGIIFLAGFSIVYIVTLI